MGFPDVNIIQRSGSSGRALPGFDYYSGMMFYGAAPAVSGKWDTYTGTPTIKAQQIFSPQDAKVAGIIPYADNTAASASVQITTAATAAGEKLIIKVVYPKQNGGTGTVVIGTYTTVAGDTVIATLGANLQTFINNGTITHGFVATFTGPDVLDIEAPAYFELSLNAGTPLVFDVTDTDIVVAITQFSGGDESDYALWYYHIKEYFRIFSSGGNIWVGIIAATDSFNELNTLQSASGGKLRQIGIMDIDLGRGSGANVSATVLQISIAAKKSFQIQPYQVYYTPNTRGVDWSDYPDQNLNIANTVGCLISQDGANEGSLLYVRQQRSIGNLGVKLATLALSRVSASDAQAIDQNNVSNGSENNVPAFSNGQLSSVVDENLQLQLQNYNYTFFRTWGDVRVGTYWNDNRCCITNASDYAYMNDNRTFQKVSRICRQTYVPLLSGEVLFNDDGTLSDEAVEAYKDAGVDAITANMITGFGVMPLISGVAIDIDPTQKVRATNNLTVVVTINQNGITRNITVDIGYGTIA